VDYVGREIDVEQWSFGWKSAGVLVLIAVRGDQVRAIPCAIDGDFAACAAADGADGFAFGGAEAVGLALFANWTRHYGLPECSAIMQNTLAEGRIKVEGRGVF